LGIHENLFDSSNLGDEPKRDLAKSLLQQKETLEELARKAREYDIPFVYEYITRLATQFAEVETEARRYL